MPHIRFAENGVHDEAAIVSDYWPSFAGPHLFDEMSIRSSLSMFVAADPQFLVPGRKKLICRKCWQDLQRSRSPIFLDYVLQVPKRTWRPR